jgi:major membrane immunogen (membrane-anchored lipoprotein)
MKNLFTLALVGIFAAGALAGVLVKEDFTDGVLNDDGTIAGWELNTDNQGWRDDAVLTLSRRDLNGDTILNDTCLVMKDSDGDLKVNYANVRTIVDNVAAIAADEVLVYKTIQYSDLGHQNTGERSKFYVESTGNGLDIDGNSVAGNYYQLAQHYDKNTDPKQIWAKVKDVYSISSSGQSGKTAHTGGSNTGINTVDRLNLVYASQIVYRQTQVMVDTTGDDVVDTLATVANPEGKGGVYDVNTGTYMTNAAALPGINTSPNYFDAGPAVRWMSGQADIPAAPLASITGILMQAKGEDGGSTKKPIYATGADINTYEYGILGLEVGLTKATDFNLDYATDVSDLIVWNTNKFVSGTTMQEGDASNDGVTDVSDLIAWNTAKFTSHDQNPGETVDVADFSYNDLTGEITLKVNADQLEAGIVMEMSATALGSLVGDVSGFPLYLGVLPGWQYQEFGGKAQYFDGFLTAGGTPVTGGMEFVIGTTVAGLTAADFGVIEYGSNAGTQYAQMDIVPEPATLALIALGGLVAIRRRR